MRPGPPTATAPGAPRPGGTSTGGSRSAAPLATAAPREPGLSCTAAVLLALAVGLVGVAFDLITGRDLRAGTAVAFVLGCAIGTFLVRRSGLRRMMFAPPLLYTALMLGTSLVRGVVPRTIPRQFVELLTRLILGAPALVAATVLAVLIGVLRGAFRRR